MEGKDEIAVIDFGGQYAHLIARRIRALGVLANIYFPNEISKILDNPSVKGVVLSGSPHSVLSKDAPACPITPFIEKSLPILGICYGHQFLAHQLGGEVKRGEKGEYGINECVFDLTSPLFKGLMERDVVWLSHRDEVSALPDGFRIIASSPIINIAGMENEEKKIFGIQFHPEVVHTKPGMQILSNFVFGICKAKRMWKTEDKLTEIKDEIEKGLRGKKCLIALSGGIDSSTAALLVKDVIGESLLAVFVDTGLVRDEDIEKVKTFSAKHNINLRIVDEKKRFFEALKDVIDPEEKRKVIGKLFAEIFKEIIEKEGIDVLIQGTIYSDRIESGASKHASTIKSHHNVGGMPKSFNIPIFEPLKELYKDEVREIARVIGIDADFIKRHVFPGPGFAIRIVGEVDEKKVEIVRKATKIVEDELRNAGIYDKIWQGFAVLLPIKSVGVQGDERSYKYVIAVRIVESADAMTANFAKLSWDILERISTRITNEIEEVNRVVYDISNKPPATIEWE